MCTFNKDPHPFGALIVQRVYTESIGYYASLAEGREGVVVEEAIVLWVTNFLHVHVAHRETGNLSLPLAHSSPMYCVTRAT